MKRLAKASEECRNGGPEEERYFIAAEYHSYKAML
jgi:hypothetical protein